MSIFFGINFFSLFRFLSAEIDSTEEGVRWYNIKHI